MNTTPDHLAVLERMRDDYANSHDVITNPIEWRINVLLAVCEELRAYRRMVEEKATDIQLPNSFYLSRRNGGWRLMCGHVSLGGVSSGGFYPTALEAFIALEGESKDAG